MSAPMSFCPHHADRQATEQCEYCGEFFCADCLATLRERRYCPACRQRLQTPAAPAPSKPRAPAREGPVLPAWASVLIYMLIFLGAVPVAQMLAAAPLVGLKAAYGVLSLEALVEDPAKVGEAFNALIFEPQGLPMPAYSLGMFIFTFGSLIAVLIPTYIFVRYVDRRPWSTFGFAWSPRVGRDLILGIVLGGLFMGSLYAVGRLAGWYRPQGVAAPLSAVLTVLTAGVILLPYAALEEVVFRGYILQRLRQRHGVAWALGVSSALFGLVHIANPGAQNSALPVLGVLLAGLYLGAAYLLTESLWLPVFLHTAWNLFEGPVFGFPVSGMEVARSVLQTQTVGPTLWTGGKFGPEAGLLLFALMIVHLGLLLALRPWLRPRPSEAV